MELPVQQVLIRIRIIDTGAAACGNERGEAWEAGNARPASSKYCQAFYGFQGIQFRQAVTRYRMDAGSGRGATASRPFLSLSGSGGYKAVKAAPGERMLSQKAKYALKALLALARAPAGELLQAGEIAGQENVPKKFLDLILLELRKHRLVDSVRGKKGGYILGRPADEIMIADIIRVIDGPLAPIACASVTAYRRCQDCKDVNACTVRLLMRDVRDAASGILDHMSLAEAAGMSTAKRRKRALVA